MIGTQLLIVNSVWPTASAINYCALVQDSSRPQTADNIFKQEDLHSVTIEQIIFNSMEYFCIKGNKNDYNMRRFYLLCDSR